MPRISLSKRTGLSNTASTDRDLYGVRSNEKEAVPVVAVHSDAKPHLGTVEAARFLDLSPRTLEKMRVKKIGPPYRKFGRRVAYFKEELLAYAASRTVKTSPEVSPTPQR
jgi:hypothetical protein